MRKASCPARRVRRNFRGRSPVGARRSPSTWSRFATPSDRPAHRRLRSACRPPSAHAGWFPARSRSTGPNADVSPSATWTSPATAPARSRTCSNGDGVPQAFVSRIFGGVWQAPERVSSDAAGRSPRSRSRPATATGSRSPGSRTASSTRRSLRAATRRAASPPAVAARRPGRARRWTSTSASTAPPTRSGSRAANVARRAAAGRDVDARRAAAGHRPRRATAGDGRAAPEGRRLGRGLRRRDVGRGHAGRAHARLGPPHHRHEPLDGPAGPQRCRATATRTRPTSTSRTTAPTRGSSFRQDIGGVVADARAAAASARSTRRRSSSTRACPATDPKVDMNGVGSGYAVAQTPGGAQVFGSWLDHDHFQPRPAAGQLDGSAPPSPRWRRPTRPTARVAWRLTGADGNSVARARYHDGEDADGAFGGELTLSRGDLGPVRRPRRVDRRRPLRRRRGRHGPGHARRAHAGGRDLRPPAGRAVHRRAPRPTSARPGPSCAGGRATTRGARRRSGSTWTAS